MVIIIINSIIYMLVVVLNVLISHIFSWLDWYNFYFILSGALDRVHPLGNIFGQSTTIRMHSSSLFVWVVHMLVFVNH